MNLGDLAFWLLLGVFAHGLGDYVFQSDWMAKGKVCRWWPAFAHGLTYTVPFLPLALWWNAPALAQVAAFAVIGGTHTVFDRFRLARHVVWAKEQLFSPKSYRRPWRECSKTGYTPGKPEWLAVLLMIIADNLVHVGINSAVIAWMWAA